MTAASTVAEAGGAAVVDGGCDGAGVSVGGARRWCSWPQTQTRCGCRSTGKKIGLVSDGIITDMYCIYNFYFQVF